jgi:hypothetical protein
LTNGPPWIMLIVAVQLNQVERAEDNPVVVTMVSKAVEVRDAGVVASDRLAVDDGRAGAQSRQRLNDERKPPRQVIAWAAIETDPLGVLAGDHSESSCLISCSQSGPDGGSVALVGKQGAMKWSACQSMGAPIARLGAESESFLPVGRGQWEATYACYIVRSHSAGGHQSAPDGSSRCGRGTRAGRGSGDVWRRALGPGEHPALASEGDLRAGPPPRRDRQRQVHLHVLGSLMATLFELKAPQIMRDLMRDFALEQRVGRFGAGPFDVSGPF